LPTKPTKSKQAAADAERLRVRKTYKLYIGGAFPRSESGRSYPVRASSGELLAHAAQASRKDLRDAVLAARKAFAGWSSATAYIRGQVLYRVAEMLDGRREQFAAERCPVGSVYGTAVAHTLLFDEPLRGNVYLRSSTNKLPDLVADLRSGAIRIVVEGQIGPGKHGGILTFFDNLPDAPIDRFTMTLGGGRHGLLQNSANICANPPLATVSALGQNNAGARFSSELRGQCKKKGKRAKRGGHRR
jgi:hypothetical protein